MLETLLVGLLIGLKHAFELDHVAAVTSMASGQKSHFSVMRHGFAWGVGHATTLLVVTFAMVATKQAINDNVAEWLEFAVGVMLIDLGIHVFWRMQKNRVHIHLHRHADSPLHLHFHLHANDMIPHAQSSHEHYHVGFPLRSLAVGIMHGMAGSAALVVIAAASLGNFTGAVLYASIFGLGSIGGMLLISVIISVPLAWSAKSMMITNVVTQSVIGIFTISIGLSLAYATKLHLLLAA